MTTERQQPNNIEQPDDIDMDGDELDHEAEPDNDDDGDDIENDAATGDETDGPLKIGEPFAMANDCEILQAQTVIRCGQCQQVFRFNPIDGAIKTCPQCGARYTHALLIGRDDDDGLFPEAIDHVLYINKPDADDQK